MNEHRLDDIPECWISRGLSEKSREVARGKLNETHERQSECLTQLRLQLERYAASHPNLIFPRLDDRFLMCFLRTARYNVDKAISLLKKYTKFRSKNKEMFEGVTPESLGPALDCEVLMALPQRDLFGRRVIVLRLANIDRTKVNALDMQRLMLYVLDALVQDEEAQVNGFVLVADYSDMTMSKAAHLKDKDVWEKNLAIHSEAHPSCFEEYHVINQPWYFGIVKSAMKPHMPGEMKKHLHMNGPCMDSLYGFIPKSVLPEDVGGEGPPYDWEAFKEFLTKAPVERPSISQVATIRNDQHM